MALTDFEKNVVFLINQANTEDQRKDFAALSEEEARELIKNFVQFRHTAMLPQIAWLQAQSISDAAYLDGDTSGGQS